MKTALTIDSLKYLKVELSPDVLFQELDGEVVLLSIKTGEYYGLNEVGARIWVLLKQDRPLNEIAQTILARYEVSDEALINDMMRFLHTLEHDGLAKVVDQGA
ncbi:MAG: PqqD family protein [Dehalococcoidia bacterium]